MHCKHLIKTATKLISFSPVLVQMYFRSLSTLVNFQTLTYQGFRASLAALNLSDIILIPVIAAAHILSQATGHRTIPTLLIFNPLILIG